jgi:outer membrane immunogenic protein
MRNLLAAVLAAFSLAMFAHGAAAAGPGMLPGSYVGVNLGVGATNFVDEDYDWYGGIANGVSAGAQIGYNKAVGSIILGIEADANWNAKSGPSQWNSTYSVDWDASLRGRIGWDAGWFTPYITAGAAIGGVRMVYSGTTYAFTPVGWTAGFGGEMALNQKTTVRLEYRHTDFGTQNYDGYNLHPMDDAVRLGLNIRLGS